MATVTSDTVEVHCFEYGSETIEFTLSYSDRKRLSITVHPDLSVEVKAPADKTFDAVMERIRHRAGWIIRQQEYFRKFHPLPTPRQYISGETHYYLGRQYRLRIRQSPEPGVRLIGQFFIVEVPERDDTEAVKYLMTQWYRDHGELLLYKHVEECWERIKKHRIPKPTVRIRKMKRRWGSFSSNGTITLNINLIKAPLHAIDYVIVHELCHLRHPNHSPAFYRLLGRCMPDWEKRKERLERVEA